MNSRRLVLVALLGVLMASWGRAEVVVERKVVTYDMKPAVGAKVTVRVFDGEGMFKQDYVTVTDAEGKFRVEAEVPPGSPDPRKANVRRAYVLVEMPGWAPMVAPVDMSPPPTTRGALPDNSLRLFGEFEFETVVLDQTGKPVGGAEVTMVSVTGGRDPAHFYLNDPRYGVSTPGCTGKSGPDGVCVMRGYTVEKDPMMCVYVEAVAPGLMTRTQHSQVVFPNPPLKIRVYPTTKLTGQVVTEGEKPLAGATVKLSGEPYGALNKLGERVTDAQGRFVYDPMPVVDELYVVVSHPEHMLVWQPVEMGQPELTSTVKLGPLVTITGKVVDADTGAAPVAPKLAVRTAYGKLGHTRGDNSLPMGLHRCDLAADGSFSVQGCVGYNRVTLDGFYYKSNNDLQVPAEGLKGLELRAEKMPAYFIRVEADDPEKLKDLSFMVRTAPTAQPYVPGNNVMRDGVAYWPAREWGEVREIEFRRNKQVVRPWEQISASKENWPLVIKIEQ